MKRIVEESLQNVNSNAGIFLAKQILDAIPSFGKFDSCQLSAKSLACQTYSNSGIAKAEVALMTLAFNVLRRIGQTARQVETEDGEKRPERTFQAVFRRLAARTTATTLSKPNHSRPGDRPEWE